MLRLFFCAGMSLNVHASQASRQFIVIMMLIMTTHGRATHRRVARRDGTPEDLRYRSWRRRQT